MSKTRQIPSCFNITVLHLKPLSVWCVVVVVSNSQVPNTSNQISYSTSVPTMVNGLCWDKCTHLSISRWTSHRRGNRLRPCTCCPRLRRWSRICCGSRTLPRQLPPPPGPSVQNPSLRWQQSGSCLDWQALPEQLTEVDKCLRKKALNAKEGILVWSLMKCESLFCKRYTWLWFLALFPFQPMVI